MSPNSGPVPGRDAETLRVVQLSDVHISASSGRDPASRAALLAEEIGPLTPSVIAVTGDLAEVDPRRLEDALAAHAWAAALESDLGVPVLVIPGNHDIGENDQHDEIAPDWRIPLVNSEFVAGFRHLWGGDRFAYSACGVTLIGINGQLLGSGISEEDEQLGWLRSELERVRAPWVLLTHQPLLLPDGSLPTKHWGLPPERARLKLAALFRETGTAPAEVLAGHLHCYAARQQGPTVHITCPSLSHTVPEEALARLAESEAVTGFLVHDLRPGAFSHWLVERGRGAPHSHDISAMSSSAS
ncbi:MAG TPA: metallophosphoesterase [Acidimicrobiales bacterium]|nr:metallophosphoesterase [Acidimicrobiales bacterium]